MKYHFSNLCMCFNIFSLSGRGLVLISLPSQQRHFRALKIVCFSFCPFSLLLLSIEMSIHIHSGSFFSVVGEGARLLCPKTFILKSSLLKVTLPAVGSSFFCLCDGPALVKFAILLYIL